MNIEQESKKSSLSQDLTVVLIRGNGSPRSFRLRVPALQRVLFSFSFALTLSVIATLFFAGLYAFRPKSHEGSPPVSAGSETAGSESAGEKTDLWKSVSGILGSSKSNDEIEKELSGLRDENAKLAAKLEARKPMEDGGSGLVQFFGPASIPAPAEEVFVTIKNPKMGRDEQKQITLDFELHNVDAQQRQTRGYILVLAKTADTISAYPTAAFGPEENVLVNYTKGETFAVSRFRAAHAFFNPAGLEGKKITFQIVLFRTDGKVLASQHVEGKP